MQIQHSPVTKSTSPHHLSGALCRSVAMNRNLMLLTDHQSQYKRTSSHGPKYLYYKRKYDAQEHPRRPLELQTWGNGKRSAASGRRSPNWCRGMPATPPSLQAQIALWQLYDLYKSPSSRGDRETTRASDDCEAKAGGEVDEPPQLGRSIVTNREHKEVSEPKNPASSRPDENTSPFIPAAMRAVLENAMRIILNSRKNIAREESDAHEQQEEQNLASSSSVESNLALAPLSNAEMKSDAKMEGISGSREGEEEGMDPDTDGAELDARSLLPSGKPEFYGEAFWI